jgi:hypothetical protein
MKCLNITFNAQGSKIIMVFVNVGTMKINITIVEVLIKKKKKVKTWSKETRPQGKSHFPIITRVIFALVYNLKFCILDIQFNTTC